MAEIRSGMIVSLVISSTILFAHAISKFSRGLTSNRSEFSYTRYSKNKGDLSFSLSLA